MEETLVNRVANSGLITLNLEDFFPKAAVVVFDLKDYLFMELILKEKDFRAALKEHNWEQYQDKILLVYCSTDAIIPVWAYMLVTAYAAPYANDIFQGNADTYYTAAFAKTLADMDAAQYEGQRIVIKGCSNRPVPASAYVALTRKLQPYAQSIMYGEPCSTVPVFKRPRKV
ncbi:MAG TPA: DUF2480 family protein [Saprospiraceae bacterium]|nr:DUF2480 family protein [Saprospiraceae bacterium]HMP24341.1 DUF2480 family protein [Saprospiraceae bacterium]